MASLPANLRMTAMSGQQRTLDPVARQQRTRGTAGVLWDKARDVPYLVLNDNPTVFRFVMHEHCRGRDQFRSLHRVPSWGLEQQTADSRPTISLTVDRCVIQRRREGRSNLGMPPSFVHLIIVSAPYPGTGRPIAEGCRSRGQYPH